MSDKKVRQELQRRLREVNVRLARTQNADEEARLLNELLYLQGAAAGIDLSEGRDTRLLRTLRRRK